VPEEEAASCNSTNFQPRKVRGMAVRKHPFDAHNRQIKVQLACSVCEEKLIDVGYGSQLLQRGKKRHSN
jgi:hypothetical protein